jgi:hypothetical protein
MYAFMFMHHLARLECCVLFVYILHWGPLSLKARFQVVRPAFVLLACLY